MIHPKKVGHVVLKVRDLQKAEQFYTEVLGFTVVTRLKRPAGVFFSLGEQHHDLAVLAVPPDATPVTEQQVGLHHGRATSGKLCRAARLLPTTESA